MESLQSRNSTEDVLKNISRKSESIFKVVHCSTKCDDIKIYIYDNVTLSSQQESLSSSTPANDHFTNHLALSKVSKVSWSPGQRPVSLQSHDKSCIVCQLITICQTSISGPYSTINSLNSSFRPDTRSEKCLLFHKAA